MGNRTIISRLTAIVFSASLSASLVWGQTVYTWNGGGTTDNFSDTGNWGGAGGNSYGVQQFGGSTRLNPFADGGGTLSTHDFIFLAGAGSFTISGREIRFFDFGGDDPFIRNNSSVLQTINNNIAADGDSGDPLRINANTGDLVLGGAINNNGSALIITGGSASRYVELGGSMTGGGNLEIDSGHVRIAQGGSINSLGGSVFVGNGTTTGTDAGLFISDADGGTTVSKTININPGDGTADNREIGGLNTSGINTFSGNIVRSGSGRDTTLSAAAGGTVDFDGVISGASGIIIQGPGIVRFGGANTYSAFTSIESGELHVKQGGTVASAGQTVFLGNGGTPGTAAAIYIADMDGGTTMGRDISVNPGSSANRTIGGLNTSGNNTFSGAITMSGSDRSATLSAASGGTVIFSGVISGSGGIVKEGAGVVRFDNTGNSYSGNTTINNGTLRTGASGVIGNSSAVSISGGATLDLNGNSEGVHSLAGAGNVTGNGGLTVLNGGTTLSGAISGTGGLVYQGSGTWTLSGVNTYSGYTFHDRGTISIGSGGDITASSGIDLGSVVYNPGGGAGTASATLDLQSGAADLDRTIVVKGGTGSRTITSAGATSISGPILMENNLTVTAGSGTLTLGAVTMNNSGDNDLAINGSGNTTIGGVITAGSGASEVNKSGVGVLAISGNNAGSSYMLNIAGGTVALNHANALGNTAFINSDKVNFNSSGTLQVNANAGTSTLDIRVANGQVGTIEVTGANVFTVDTLRNVSGSGTFTKTGSGTLEIVGSSTLSGTLNINAGTVDMQGTVSTASINVNGGTLTGDGTAGATLVIGSGGVLSPGNSPGTINAGNTTWAGGGSYLWEINDVDAGAGSDPGWDLLNVTGTLTISATSGNEFDIDITSLTLANAAGDVHDFNGLNNYSWIIASASGGISGFDASDFTLSLGGFSNPYDTTPGSWFISQSGNNILLNYNYLGGPIGGGGGGGESAVPEPNTLLYFGLATAGLLAFRRKALIARAA